MSQGQPPVLVIDGVTITVDQMTEPLAAFGQTLQASPVPSQQRLGELMVELATVGEVSANMGENVVTLDMEGVMEDLTKVFLNVGVELTMAFAATATIAPFAE